MINLPENIDYTKYNSFSGMSTIKWGPAFWNALFISIMGRYPVKINKTIIDHLETKKAFKNMLCSLQMILPCIFCRNSLKEFVKKLPIDEYLVGRIELMFWLYQIKDKVNKKLLCQEKICYNDEKKRLKKAFYTKEITELEYYSKIKEFKKETFITIPSPPFQEVLDHYESFRANCDNRAKKCSLPLSKNVE